MVDAGAQRNQYQVVLSGELMPGHDSDEALTLLVDLFTASPALLRNIFDGASRRVQQSLSADDALNLQAQLQQVGVRAHVERMTGPEMLLILRHPPISASTATAAKSAASSVQRAVAEPPGKPMTNPQPAAPAPRPVSPGPSHAEKHWHDAWADSHVDDEPDENERLAAFVGPAAPAYIRRFARVRLNNRPNLRPSWNWGAFVSPFLWALYRKLWFWAMVIGLVEIVVPVMMFILARHGVLPSGFAQVAFLSVVANRLFWPTVADYLYFRHSHFSLLRLFRMSPGYASELDIANAGGVNRSAILVGMAFSGVFALFVWSLVSSVTQTHVDPFEARVSALARQQDPASVQTPGEVLDNTARNLQEENRWSTTRRKLRELGQIVTTWMSSQSTNKDPSQLNLFKLREDTGVAPAMLTDGWGNEVHLLSDNEGYRLISAGPDQLFGTADDIMYQRVMAR